jgi:hypothetical protein
VSSNLLGLLGPEDEGLRSPRRLFDCEDEVATILQSIGNCLVLTQHIVSED